MDTIILGDQVSLPPDGSVEIAQKQSATHQSTQGESTVVSNSCTENDAVLGDESHISYSPRGTPESAFSGEKSSSIEPKLVGPLRSHDREPDDSTTEVPSLSETVTKSVTVPPENDQMSSDLHESKGHHDTNTKPAQIADTVDSTTVVSTASNDHPMENVMSPSMSTNDNNPPLQETTASNNSS
mgnify:CR=1 FL=1